MGCSLGIHGELTQRVAPYVGNLTSGCVKSSQHIGRHIAQRCREIDLLACFNSN